VATSQEKKSELEIQVKLRKVRAKVIGLLTKKGSSSANRSCRAARVSCQYKKVSHNRHSKAVSNVESVLWVERKREPITEREREAKKERREGGESRS